MERFFAMLAPKCTRVGDKNTSNESVDDCHDAQTRKRAEISPQPSRRCGEIAKHQHSTRLSLIPTQYRTFLHRCPSRSSTSPSNGTRGSRNDLMDEQRGLELVKEPYWRKHLVQQDVNFHFCYTKLQH
jgi:hypothetical protein